MIFDEDSVTIASQIAQHPLCGPAVRTLHFYIDIYCRPERAHYMPGVPKEEPWLDWDRGQLQATMRRHQIVMQSSSGYIQMMARRFRVLSVHNRLHEIVFTSLANDTRRPIMLTPFLWWNQLVHDYNGRFDSAINEAFLTVEMAAKATPNTLTSLQSFIICGNKLMIVPSTFTLTSHFRWGLSATVKQTLRHSCILQNITTAQLYVGSIPEQDSYVATLLGQLARSSKLTSLDLTFRRGLRHSLNALSRSHDRMASYPLMQQRFETLEHLKLKWAWLDLDDLKQFVQSQSKLQSFTFEGIWFTADDDDHELCSDIEPEAILEERIEFTGFKIVDMEEFRWLIAV